MNLARKVITRTASVFLLAALAPVQAALIPVTNQEHDVYAGLLSANYDWTNKQGGSGTLTIDGHADPTFMQYRYFHNLNAADPNSWSDNFQGTFSLTANFDSNGLFTDGTFFLDVDSGGPIGGTTTIANDTDTIVSANLTAFGLSGSGSSGAMDFTFDTVSGVWHDLGATSTGLIFGIEIGTGAPLGSWDNVTLMQHDWNQDAVDFSVANVVGHIETAEIPVPAAIWLFGSGLVGLAAVGRRRK